jgi:hypothetical protein
MAMIVLPLFCMNGISFSTSSVCPELAIASTTSFFEIIPRSP